MRKHIIKKNGKIEIAENEREKGGRRRNCFFFFLCRDRMKSIEEERW